MLPKTLGNHHMHDCRTADDLAFRRRARPGYQETIFSSSSSIIMKSPWMRRFRSTSTAHATCSREEFRKRPSGLITPVVDLLADTLPDNADETRCLTPGRQRHPGACPRELADKGAQEEGGLAQGAIDRPRTDGPARAESDSSRSARAVSISEFSCYKSLSEASLIRPRLGNLVDGAVVASDLPTNA